MRVEIPVAVLSYKLKVTTKKKKKKGSNMSSLPCSIDEIIAKCLSIGLVVRRAPSYEITHPALTLQPTIVTEQSFRTVETLQPIWNLLVDRAARDSEFLNRHLSETAASDKEFVGRLVSLYNDVYVGDGKVFQPLMLGIFRADYMRDLTAAAQGQQEWKNVEINTISVSFAALSTRVGQLHEFFKQVEQVERGTDTQSARRGNVVVSDSINKIPAALAAAHNLVLSTNQPMHLVPVVVFVIQDKERNTGDQYLLSFGLLANHGVRSIRRTLTELHAELTLTTPSGGGAPTAIIGNKYIATVFYFRSCYVPTDFITESCWSVRRDIELSSAVKCPSLPYHLMTTKKLQQVLSEKQTLARYVTNAEACDALHNSFVGQWSLNADEVGAEAVASRILDAVANPSKYVLKPQLEGGGNLFAGAKMVAQLQTTQEEDPAQWSRVRKEYILMERIHFAVTSGSLLRFGEVVHLKDNMCCELGTFGTILSDGSPAPALNEYAGYVVRSKPADVDDGGVMAGVAALDCVELVPQ